MGNDIVVSIHMTRRHQGPFAVDIVWVKLDNLCRGELNHSNVPYSRFWSCVMWVIPIPDV
uniref:Uncharacterized protein n=1 Tax=Oryza barthii TaxID=65489 RepID=A0A0D3GPR0_9ORYZ